MITPIKEIVNEMHAAETSKKMRYVKKLQAENGDFSNTQAPYGYKKSPKNKHRFDIDEYAAQIVLRIFTEFDKGHNARDIGGRLTVEEIDCPLFHYYKHYKEGATPPPKKIKGKNGKPPYMVEMKNVWNSNTIYTILERMEYLGFMASGKRRNLSYKSPKRVDIPKSEWIIRPDMHKPIIDADLFERVQERIASKPKNRRRAATGTYSLFAGVLKCSKCGRALAYSTKKDGGRGYYRCSAYNVSVGGCTPHNIYEDDLCAFILNDLRNYAALSATERERLTKRLMSAMNQAQSNEAGALNVKIQEGEYRLKEIQRLLKVAFEKNCSGILDDNEFISLKADYAKEKAEIEERLPRLRRELDNVREAVSDIGEWLSLVTNCIDLEHLDRETVMGLVDRIVIGEKDKVKKVQEITIHYRFIGNLLKSVEPVDDTGSAQNTKRGHRLVS
jgi:hypothetical protein